MLIQLNLYVWEYLNDLFVNCIGTGHGSLSRLKLYKPQNRDCDAEVEYQNDPKIQQ